MYFSIFNSKRCSYKKIFFDNGAGPAYVYIKYFKPEIRHIHFTDKTQMNNLKQRNYICTLENLQYMRKAQKIMCVLDFYKNVLLYIDANSEDYERIKPIVDYASKIRNSVSILKEKYKALLPYINNPFKENYEDK